MVDIGQGDSILLREKFGKVILIDLGGIPGFKQKENWRQRTIKSNAEQTLIPFLKSRGISTIDQVILTHTEV